MPRPSDVYATLGAPGVYQATPWTPCQLPNVYVFPPEEDNQDVFCLFHSGSASPTPFESFYRDPIYAQRDPSSPTFTDVTALDQALTYFRRGTSPGQGADYTRGPAYGEWVATPSPSRNNSSSSMSSASSGSSSSGSVRARSTAIASGRNIYSNLGYLNGTEEGCLGGQEGQSAPSRAASRRSSIFGERPPDYEVFETRVREEDRPGLRKSRSLTLKNKAASAFRAIGSVRVRRTESHAVLPGSEEPQVTGAVSRAHQSWFELVEREAYTHKKRGSRRTLAQLFGSNSNLELVSPSDDETPMSLHQASSFAPPSSTPRELKLSKRKSVTQLLGLTRNSEENIILASHSYAGLPVKSSALSLREPKLSKRKSMAQLLGLGRSTSPMELPDGRATGTDDIDTTDARLASLQALEGAPSIPPAVEIHSSRPVVRRSIASPAPPQPAGPDSAISLVTHPSDGTPSMPGRRKSFLGARTLTFFSLHRRFTSSTAPDSSSQKKPYTEPSAPATPSSASKSPDSLSVRTDSSSSVLASTDYGQHVEDGLQVFEPYVGVPGPPTLQREGPGPLAQHDALELIPSDQLNLKKEIDYSSSFGMHTQGDDDGESQEDEVPTLELSIRLDSLSFDQLIFDPESFASATYD